MEEDDMVMRVGMAIPRTERDEPMKSRPEELIRRCQGLAEG